MIDFIDFSEEDEYDEEVNPPREVRCRDCGSEDVYWAQNSTGRWTLYDFKSSKRHVCNNKVVSERRLDAFDDET